MRLIWCTDIHLDHCPDISMFINDVLMMQPDRVLVTGDISNATQIENHLTVMAEQLNIPIDFVLGNHDYYGVSPYFPAKMHVTRKKVNEVVNRFSNLNWLETSGPIQLTDNAALIGSSLWCDWKVGLKDKSTVWLNDYLLISDLFGYPNSNSDRNKIKRKIRDLAKQFTVQLMNDFQKAIDQGYKKIIIGTHVPPFHEASFYDGKVSDDNWAPHFVCKTAGDEIYQAAKNNPDVDITLLYGHTHGMGKKDILSNLHAINGEAIYRHPKPQTPIIL